MSVRASVHPTPHGVTVMTDESATFSGCLRSLTRAQPGPGKDVPGPVHVGVHAAVNRADDECAACGRRHRSPQTWQSVLV